MSWLYAPSVVPIPTDDDVDEHGSCVTSRAVGEKIGVSKRTPLIIVKSALVVSDIVWAFQAILDDIAAHPNRRAVVMLAFGSIYQANPSWTWIPQPWRRLKLLMGEAIMADAVIVVPSGNAKNGAERRWVDQYPGLFTNSGMGHLPLTLVGAVDNTGLEAYFSQESFYVKAYAPGIDVECARFGQIERESGTSISVGMVAGLAAYFLGFPNPPFAVGGGRTAENFNNFLQNTASWSRQGRRDPNMIWNLQDGSSIHLSLNMSKNSVSSKLKAI